MRRILVVAPHPDDETYGCGGALARYGREGDETHVLIVTKGDDLFDQQQVEQVRGEAHKAHQVLGVKQTHFADLPAIKLDTLPQYQIAETLSEFFGQIKPDLLFLPFAGDINHDHQIVHACSMVAARPHSIEISAIYCYEALSSTNWNSPGVFPAFVPSVFMDITADLSVKLQAVEAYASQLQKYPHERSLDSVIALSRYRGGFANLPHAEAFMSIREILRS